MQLGQESSRSDGLRDLLVSGDARGVIARSGRTVMELSQRLQLIEEAMSQLAADMRIVNGVGLQLAVQKRDTGAVSLRWRDGRQRTLSAARLLQVISTLPTEARAKYSDMDMQVRWLNAQERLLRHARQVLRELYAMSN